MMMSKFLSCYRPDLYLYSLTVEINAKKIQYIIKQVHWRSQYHNVQHFSPLEDLPGGLHWQWIKHCPDISDSFLPALTFCPSDFSGDYIQPLQMYKNTFHHKTLHPLKRHSSNHQLILLLTSCHSQRAAQSLMHYWQQVMHGIQACQIKCMQTQSAALRKIGQNSKDIYEKALTPLHFVHIWLHCKICNFPSENILEVMFSFWNLIKKKRL